MKILSGEQMARWDRVSIKRYGISPKTLMLNAAKRCVEVLQSRIPLKRNSQILIVCGPGNNGGDGLAIACLLRRSGLKPKIFFLGNREKLSLEAGFFYDQVVASVQALHTSSDFKTLKKSLRQAEILIDALFGIGLKRTLVGPYKRAVQAMNQSPAFKLAVDMPSGISADSGEVMGAAFRADVTVTFEVPKWGQILEPAWEWVGELFIKPIGLCRKALDLFKTTAQWLEPGEIRRFFSRRPKSIHKGKAGEVLVIAGSSGMPGAGYLCAVAALRSGAGLVRWALPAEAFQKIDLKFPEVILQPISSQQGQFSRAGREEIKSLLSGSRALAVGPGLGTAETVQGFVRELLKLRRPPSVFDADALNLLAQTPSLLRHCRPALLTPHPKEMARLAQIPLAEVLSNRIRVALRFAKKYRLWLVVKGYRSVIAGPGGEVWINSSGGPNLATAGSGDVLCGVVAGLLAQGLNPRKALLAGVYLHGRAGDLVAGKLGDRGTLASEVAQKIPVALKELLDRA